MRARTAAPARRKRPSSLPGPAVCGGCGAVFRRGRWRWADRFPKGAARVVCQACRRVGDGRPAGIMTLSGGYVRPHLKALLAVARHQEHAELKEHPLRRIMAVEEKEDKVVIKTTDIHLPARIGRAMLRSFKGELDLKYDEGAGFVRVGWTRSA